MRFGRCGVCEVAYCDPLRDDEIAALGHESVSRTAPVYIEQMRRHHEARRLEGRVLAGNRTDIYAKHLGRPVGSLLEVGCGTGPLADGFENAGVRWSGIDIDGGNVAFARAQGVPVERCDFLDYDGPRVDVVCASQVLEHVLQPRRFLERARELLTPGGLLHLDVPNHNGLTARVRKLPLPIREYGFLQPPHHLVAYPPRSLRLALESTGFDVLLLEARSNGDADLGQLRTGVPGVRRIALQAAGAVGLGSLLVAISRVGGDGSASQRP